MTRREWLLALAVCWTWDAVLGQPLRDAEDPHVTAGRLLDAGEFEKAAVIYEKLLAVEQDPATRARILNNLGFCRFRQKNIDVAIRHYADALVLDPSYATCLNNMGAALIGQRRFADAVRYLERGFRVAKSVKLAFNLFVAHYRLNHQREALFYIEHAFILDPSYTEARLKTNNVRTTDIEKLKRHIRKDNKPGDRFSSAR